MRVIGKVIGRSGLVIAACVAMFAVSGIGASDAMACVTGQIPSAGEGAGLQGIAQGIWTTNYFSTCEVTYTANASGQGLIAFGFGNESINHKFQFVGTDDAPDEVQIENAEAVAGGAEPVIVPVTQTAIAVVVHPPTGCTLSKITSIDLNKVFGGNAIKNWNEFETATGGASCKSPVTRVVRNEGSGVTYQFKNYLATVASQLGGENLPCTTEFHTKWIELREIGTEEDPNRIWPECSGGSSVVRAAGDAAEAAKVVATTGTIGYASLPNAVAQGATIASLQNGLAAGVPTYASPKGASSNANCSATVYDVPSAAQSGSPASDWSEVFGAYPQIGGTAYPLCTLTYDIGWRGYATAGYGMHSPEYATTVKSYLRFVLSKLQQGAIGGHWYAGLPTGLPTFDVWGAAELAAEEIN
jgi:ABC-type phosphate transport system substrate-binding protein